MRIPEPDSQYIPEEHEHLEHTSLRMIWFAFVGWWLSAIWAIAAWLCILFMPSRTLGLRMLGGSTWIMALRVPGADCDAVVADTLQRLQDDRIQQHRTLPRLLYAVVIGWWLSFIWLVIAWGRSLSIQCRPSGQASFMRLPRVMTLRKY